MMEIKDKEGKVLAKIADDDTEALWERCVKETESFIKKLKDDLIINEAILAMAKSHIHGVSTTQNKRGKGEKKE